MKLILQSGTGGRRLTTSIGRRQEHLLNLIGPRRDPMHTASIACYNTIVRMKRARSIVRYTWKTVLVDDFTNRYSNARHTSQSALTSSHLAKPPPPPTKRPFPRPPRSHATPPQPHRRRWPPRAANRHGRSAGARTWTMRPTHVGRNDPDAHSLEPVRRSVTRVTQLVYKIVRHETAEAYDRWERMVRINGRMDRDGSCRGGR